MPLPQVSDRIKELPGQALRAVFAGVGQLLLAADKVRAQLAAPPDEPPAARQLPCRPSPRRPRRPLPRLRLRRPGPPRRVRRLPRQR